MESTEVKGLNVEGLNVEGLKIEDPRVEGVDGRCLRRSEGLD